MGLKLNGATSGSIEIDVPAVAGTDTAITIPATTGGEFIVSDSSGNIDLGPLDINGGASDDSVNIDGSGRLLVGTSTASATVAENWTKLEIRNDNQPCAFDIVRNDQTVDSDTTVGLIRFWNNDNVGYQELARIAAMSDDAYSSDDKPTRLVFSTTADGASSPTERMRIESNGDALLGTTNGNDYSTADGRLNVVYPSTAGTNTHCIKAYHTNTSFAEDGGGLLFVASRRSASSDFTMAGWYTGNNSTSITSDRQFRFRGDGNGYCDGSWNGGGADYAEYFEWSDGNATAEDRRGISVVLDNDKIREAAAGEEPIGVISGNPSVIGDADDNRWKKKYLRDDFGSYVWEDYNPIDDDGNPKQDDDGNLIVQKRQKLNPDYNPDIEYVSREDRPEWDCVGLMGKLRIRKGQVTGARWIKMRDVSDSVEEWLVR